MKKLLFVINGLGGGGSQRNTTILANHFVEAGCEVSIAVLLDPCDPFFELLPAIDVIDLSRPDRSRKKNLLFWRKQSRALIKSKGITDVIAIGYRFGFICAFALPKRVRLFVRGTMTRHLSRTDRLLFKVVNRKITGIVAQTKSQKDSYPKYLFPKIHIISNPFETFDANMNNGGYASKRLICIGRLHLPQKRQDFIIKSLMPFLKANPDYSLEFYGEPQIDDGGVTLPYLRGLIESSGMQGRILIRDVEKNVWLHALPCFAFVCASTREGMPNALIEGMSRGVIPLTTYWDGCNEIITNGEDGFISSKTDDVVFFERAIKELEADPVLYNRMSSAAVAKAKKSFSTEKALISWDRLISTSQLHK